MRLLKACAPLLAFLFLSVNCASAQPISDEGLRQIQAFVADKESWTPAEKKLQSTLLYAARFRSQGFLGSGLPVSNAGVDGFIATNVAPDTTVAVTIRGDINADLIAALSAAAGADIRSYPQFDRVTLRLPLASLLGIAQRPDVQFITPTAKPILNRHLEDASQSAAALLAEQPVPLGKPTTKIAR